MRELAWSNAASSFGAARDYAGSDLLPWAELGLGVTAYALGRLNEASEHFVQAMGGSTLVTEAARLNLRHLMSLPGQSIENDRLAAASVARSAEREYPLPGIARVLEVSSPPRLRWQGERAKYEFEWHRDGDPFRSWAGVDEISDGSA